MGENQDWILSPVIDLETVDIYIVWLVALYCYINMYTHYTSVYIILHYIVQC